MNRLFTSPRVWFPHHDFRDIRPKVGNFNVYSRTTLHSVLYSMYVVGAQAVLSAVSAFSKTIDFM